MVIQKSAAFALRCTECGKLEINNINIFQLSGNKGYDIICECGNRKCTLSRKKKGVELSFYCIICDYEHNLIIPESKFWSAESSHPLICPNTDLNLGYYGNYHQTYQIIQKQQQDLNSMANELGFDEFVNPEILLEVLDYLHDIAAQGKLYCECGSYDIYIDLAPDKVRLSCGYCNSEMIIPAAAPADLKKLKEKKELKLEESSETGSPVDPWINI